jgi:thiol-disulfide isomerase/thioredoxin
MKKIIPVVVAVVFTCLAIFLISGIVSKTQRQKQIAEKIKRFPSFSFMTLSDGSFNSSDIKKGPVLVVHFHPECEHCRYEISEILKSTIPESGTNIIMVSGADPDSIRSFIRQFDNAGHPSIFTLADTSYIFGDIFGRDIVPSNYIYDKDLYLIKVFYGEVKTEAILKYLPGSE